MSPMQFVYLFEAFQDNDPAGETALRVTTLPDDQFHNTQSKRIQWDDTVANAIGYELDDVEAPVELAAFDSTLGDEIGRTVYEVQ